MIPRLSEKEMLEWYRGRVRELEAELVERTARERRALAREREAEARKREAE